MKRRIKPGKPVKASRPVQIMVVDDHPLVREGLRVVLEGEPGLAVCCEAADVESALSLLEKNKPDMMIVDISLHGRDGLELMTQVKNIRPDLPIMVLSVHDETTYVERALKIGARGYVTKQEASTLLIEAVRTVLRGEIFLSRRMSTPLVERLLGSPHSEESGAVGKLSNRELQILNMIGRGSGTAEISRALHLSASTIQTHRSHIKDKLSLDTSAGLAKFAADWIARTTR